MTKQLVSKYIRLEKIIAFIGYVTIALTLIATIFTLFVTSKDFIHDTLDVIYYCKYLILIGGGYLVGYFVPLAKHKKTDNINNSSKAAAHAFLALLIYYLVDIIRVSIMRLIGFDYFTYPWGKIIFEGAPIASLLLLFMLSACIYHKSHAQLTANKKYEIIFAVIFTAVQIGTILTGLIASEATISLFLLTGALINLLLSSFGIAILAYLLLKQIDDKTYRAYYSALIGSIFTVFTALLWEFRTNAEWNATETFGYIVLTIVATFIGMVLWRSLRAPIRPLR